MLRIGKKDEAPHLRRLTALRCSSQPDNLTRTYHIATQHRNDLAPRLERPGIEPGAVQVIRLTVDTIEAPQRVSNPSAIWPG